MKALKVLFLSACIMVACAVPAFAQVTPADVKDDVLAEATPYFAILVGVIIALFGAGLIVTLARKAAGMARGTVKKG